MDDRQPRVDDGGRLRWPASARHTAAPQSRHRADVGHHPRRRRRRDHQRRACLARIRQHAHLSRGRRASRRRWCAPRIQLRAPRPACADCAGVRVLSRLAHYRNVDAPRRRQLHGGGDAGRPGRLANHDARGNGEVAWRAPGRHCRRGTGRRIRARLPRSRRRRSARDRGQRPIERAGRALCDGRRRRRRVLRRRDVVWRVADCGRPRQRRSPDGRGPLSRRGHHAVARPAV